MTRKISFSVGEYYHLYNRGVDKRNIFANKNDYGRFTALLYLCNSSKPINISKHFDRKRSFQELFVVPRKNTLVEIVSYCLMPNHFHILVYEKRESGISRFMQKLSTAYSMYFNVKRGRTGGLSRRNLQSKTHRHKSVSALCDFVYPP